MDQTTNYKLPQWVEDDRIMMEDFNDAMAKIDAGIAGAKTAADSAQSTAEAGSATTNQVLQTITADLGNGGKNCRIAYGSYTGKGTYGAANPNSLTFGFYPVVLYVVDLETAKANGNSVCLLRSCNSFTSFMSSTTALNWSNSGVSWYNTSYVEYQYNISEHTYYYCAIGYSNN